MPTETATAPVIDVKAVETTNPIPAIRRPGKAARVSDDSLMGDLTKLRTAAPAAKPVAKAKAVAKAKSAAIEGDVAVPDVVMPEDPPEDDSDLDPPQPKADEDPEAGDDKPIVDPDAADETEKEATLTPAESKRLADAQRKERQWKERQATDRATWEREKAAHAREWQPRIDAAEAFEKLKGRARYAPDAVLEALGLGEDDWEPVARLIYARSPAGQKDPNARAAAERMAREREGNDRLSAVERELADTKKQLAGRDQEAQVRATVDKYLGGVTKAVAEGTWRDPDTREIHKVATPLVKAWLAKAPEKARAALHRVALDLLNEDDGRTPAPHEVATELERRRREDLAELDVDVEAVAAPKGTLPAKPKPGPTLQRSPGGGTRARETPVSRDQLFESLQAELKTVRLDS